MSANVSKPANGTAIQRAESASLAPFFVAMIGALGFFVWQIVEYTTLLG